MLKLKIYKLSCLICSEPVDEQRVAIARALALHPDILFFDELFLMPMYVCIGVSFISNQDDGGDLIKNKGERFKLWRKA